MGDTWTWIRDFTLYGGLIGTLAPLAVLVPMAMGNHDGQVLGLVVFSAVGGTLMGSLVGGLLWSLRRVAGERTLLISPAGFPVGMLAGVLVGTPIGSAIHSEAVWVVGGLGAITGGLVLGFSWLPYLALRTVGRSGLPVVVAGGLASPLMGVVAVLSLMASGL